MLENPELIVRLDRCRDLPTPPGVAERIIALSSDSNSDISVLAEVVSIDPALTVKILRMANSPMYARQTKVETLEQAVMMFGWNGMLNLALSFSLVTKVDPSSKPGLDYKFFWKRSICAAVSAKHLSKVVGVDSRKEDLFLPGLLQDIGMLALDRAVPDLYSNIGENQHQHKTVQQIEIDRLGVDHASVGAWLLERWNLPNKIIDLVEISHNGNKNAKDDNATAAENCIKISNVLADCICSDESKKDYHDAANLCEKMLGLDEKSFVTNLDEITSEIKEVAAIFEIDVGDPLLLNCIAEQAKELLLLRSMQTLKTAEELYYEAEHLELKAKKLEDVSRIDPLTKIYNRGYLEKSLKREFEIAENSNCPLTVVMVDLDHFKKVNDSHGHGCGDKALVHAVEVLKSCIRDTDSLYRYGGEEFVVILPNTGSLGAESFASRIIKTFNNKKFAYKDNEDITITASLGIAIQGEGIYFDSWDHLLDIADYCLYASKANGRNQYTLYKEESVAKAAVG